MTEINDNVEKVTVKNSMLNTIKEYAVIAIGAIIISFLLSQVVKPGAVIGQSMDNTLHNGDYVLINKIAYKTGEPEYKDIVVLNTNIENGRILIKRVIGVPGDTIKIEDNQLYINGSLVKEDYINEPMAGNENTEVVIPQGKIFVMGDNRNHSLDSRSLMVGLVDYHKDVIGKVMSRIYPFKSIEK